MTNLVLIKYSRKPSYKCRTRYCRGTGHRKRGGLCGKCSMRRWRQANPVKYRLTVLRQRAARKGVPFNLTLPWLTQFLIDNPYDPTTQHIDRVKVSLGYVMGNLQILDAGENIAKGNRERHRVEEPF